ncbi:hypothetical protein ACOME3_009020 [Neoechinorhynchus agilis]
MFVPVCVLVIPFLDLRHFLISQLLWLPVFRFPPLALDVHVALSNPKGVSAIWIRCIPNHIKCKLFGYFPRLSQIRIVLPFLSIAPKQNRGSYSWANHVKHGP